MQKEKFFKLTVAAAALGVVAAVTIVPVKAVYAESASGASAPVDNRTDEDRAREAKEAQERAIEAREAHYQAEIDEQIKEFVSQSVPENKTVDIPGANVKTTVDGIYLAKSVEGIAITSPKSEIAASLGCSENDVTVSTWDVSPSKSPLAYNYMEQLVANMPEENVTLGPVVQVNVLAKTKSGYKAEGGDAQGWEKGQFDMVIGLPDDFVKEGAQYRLLSVVRSERGDSYSGFDGQDIWMEGNAIHFKGLTGDGVYALVRID
ncbi:MAG: hypothetical protein K6A38_10175 [Lachnospiraceae bacterium]|nr:hypothetical protein [Lachnospiraceae bacterium]